MMKKGITSLSLTCMLGITLFSCQSDTNEQAQELVLTNPASVALTDKAISVKRTDIPEIPEGQLYPLLLTQAGDTVAAQLDDLNGDAQWDELFFVTDLPANEEKVLKLAWVNTQPNFPKRTSVRFGKRTSKDSPVQPKTSDILLANQLPKSIGYQPYQTDGPSWENDKVGFRHYFDGRNAKDFFGKKVAYMSPEDVGISASGAVEDNYHEMKDWGRDIMAVGNSVGIGGIAMMIGDSLYRLGVTVDDSVNNVESTNFDIITEGPVRSSMRIRYNNWKPDNTDRSYTIEEQPTIWPGMYAYQNTVKVANLQGDENLLIGINNLDPTDKVTEIPVDDNWIVLLTHDRETYNNEWILGLALILPKNAYLGYTEAPETGKLSRSHFAKMKVANNEPVQYFAVGGWESGNEAFKDSTAFKNYVQELTRQIATDVSVKFQ